MTKQQTRSLCGVCDYDLWPCDMILRFVVMFICATFCFLNPTMHEQVSRSKGNADARLTVGENTRYRQLKRKGPLIVMVNGTINSLYSGKNTTYSRGSLSDDVQRLTTVTPPTFFAEYFPFVIFSIEIVSAL